MKKLRHILLAASVLSAAACNNGTNDTTVSSSDTSTSTVTATDTSNHATTTATPLAQKDAQFLMDVAESNMAEIKMAQQAQNKGNSQDVKDIAKMLETDHSAVLNDVKNFASSHSVTLPTEENKDHKDAYNMLDKKSGKDFDKEWVDHMIDGHKKGIAKFESEQNDAADADLKTWVGNTLPKLRTHLDKLQECKKKLK